MTELPPGWALCAIGEVVEPVSVTQRHEADRPIWYLDISSIDNVSNRIAEPKRMMLGEAPSQARQIVKAGDVLFSTVRPYLRKIAAVDARYDGEIASTGFAVLRAARGIEPRYLFYKCISHDFVSALTGEQYGVSYPAVKEEQVRAQPLELPPTAEQRRIVERIEALFAEIDKGVESLRTARARLGLYRRSLLKSAFDGSLTADWRARNSDKLESPEALLARIREEREARWKSALDDWQAAFADWRAGGEKGRKPAKPKRPPNASQIQEAETGKRHKLPHSWRWARLGDLFWISPKNGLYKPASNYGSGVNIVRIDDFYDGKLTKREGFKRVELDGDEHDDFALSAGDILINRVNSIYLVGKCAEVTGLNELTVFESNIMKCRAIRERCGAPWIVRFLSSPVGRMEIRRNAKHAVNQASINQNDVAEALVPICSPAEQAEIVRILDARLEAADALEAEIDAGLARAEALRQSVLKAAFSGRLVPQDPADEPATALLDRLRAERAAAPAPRRRRRARARA